MSKHTPGPWQAFIDGESGDVMICADNGVERIADGVGENNARLIAEAPAMLEALRAFVESAEEGGMCSVCGAEPRGDKRTGTFIPRCPSWCVAESARAILARIDGPTTEGEEA